MGIPDHLTCLLRNLYAGQEATVRTEHGTTDGFQIGKGVCQDCILSPCLFNLHAEFIMGHSGLDEAQAGFKLHEGRNYAKFCSQAWTQALILKVSQKKAEGPEGGGQGRGKPCIHGCSPVFDILEVFRERGGDLCVRASDMHPDPLAGTVSWIRKKQ